MQSPVTAYSYERVSQAQQATGRGLARQSDAAAAWAAKHGLTLDTRLALSDAGRSASKGDHLTKGALGKFLQLAQAGQLGSEPILLVEAIDRLSRQEPLDAIETILTGLVGSGVRIITLEDGAEYSRQTLRSDPTKLLVLVVKMQAAYEYSARLGMRIKDSWDKVRQQLRSGTMARPGHFCPAWCDWDAERGYRFNSKAETVRLIMEMLPEHGCYVVAQHLNAQGIPTFRGKRWNHSNVRAVATTPAIYGAVRLNTKPTDGSPPEIFEGLLPAVVSKEQARLVRDQLARRDKGAQNGPAGTTRWIGQGFTYCVCGARMGTTIGGSPGKRRYYLRCRHRETERQGCSRPGIPLQAATAHLLTRLQPEQLESLLAACHESDARQGRQVAVQVAQQRCDELSQQQRNTESAFKAAARAGVDLSAALAVQQEVEQELTSARRALSDAKRQLEQLNEAAGSEGAIAPVLELQRAFALGQDSAEQRRAVNLALRRMGMAITLDTAEGWMQLQLGEGAGMQRQQIRALDRAALYSGDTLGEVAGLVVAQREADFAAELRRSQGAEIH
jgi:DNA invertase Pin-like site-specific DNA recombinase